MRKTFASFFVFLAAALPAAAVSTCETRVDAHQDATTKQRVVYCLTPEKEPAPPQGPQVLYYNVTDKTPAQDAAQKDAEKEPVYFNKDGVVVNHYFQDTKEFPVFENDSLSVQEGLASKEEGKQAAACKEAKCEAQLDAVLLAEGFLADGVAQESAAGIKARKTKPSRFMKEIVQDDFSQPADPYAAGYDPANAAAGSASYGQQATSADPYAAAGYDPANAAAGTASYGQQAAPADPYAAYQPSYQQPDYTQPGANPYAAGNTQPAAGVNPYAGGATADSAYAAPAPGAGTQL